MEFGNEDFEKLKALVKDQPFYKGWLQQEAELLMEIQQLRKKGLEVDYTLRRRLYNIGKELELRVCGNYIIDGYNDNKPYAFSGAGNNRLTETSFQDSEGNRLKNFYTYKISDPEDTWKDFKFS